MWDEEHWQNTCKLIRDYVASSRERISPEVVQRIEESLRRGDSHPAERSGCMSTVQFELADCKGITGEIFSPVKTTPSLRIEIPDEEDDEHAPPPKMEVVKSPQKVFARGQQWLAKHEEKVQKLAAERDRKEAAELTLKPTINVEKAPAHGKLFGYIHQQQPAPGTLSQKSAKSFSSNTSAKSAISKSSKKVTPRAPTDAVKKKKSSTSAAAASKKQTVKVGALELDEDLQSKVEAYQFDQSVLERLCDKYAAVAQTNDVNATVSREVFDQLMHELGITDDLLLQQLFTAFSEGGELNFRDFVGSLAALTGAVEFDDILKLCFRLYDTDNDGRISREEVTRVLAAALQDEDQDQLLFVVMMIFNIYDNDKDGFLTRDEFTRMCESDKLLLLYIQNKLKQHTGQEALPVESVLLEGAKRLQEEDQQRRKEEEEGPEFDLDPTSTAEVGRLRLQDPEVMEPGADFRKASGLRGISLYCGRNSTNNNIEVFEIRFDLTRLSKRDCAFWWRNNEHRFQRVWTKTHWEQWEKERQQMRALFQQ